MTRTDFLKLIPAAILALFWPEEAKAEANTPLSDIWECDPAEWVHGGVTIDGSQFADGHGREFVSMAKQEIRATSATFTQPVKFMHVRVMHVRVMHVRAYWDKSRDRIVVEDEWPEDAE